MAAEDVLHYWEHLFVVCISVALAQLWAGYTVNKMTQATTKIGAPKPKDSLPSLVFVSAGAMLLLVGLGLPIYLPNAGFRVIT